MPYHKHVIYRVGLTELQRREAGEQTEDMPPFVTTVEPDAEPVTGTVVDRIRAGGGASEDERRAWTPHAASTTRTLDQ